MVGFNFFAEVLFDIVSDIATDITASRVRLVVLLGANVPNILAQGLVLALLFERHLVKRCLVWICQTCVHRFCDSTEHGLVINLCLRVLGRTFAVGLGVVEFTCYAVCEADLVGLR